MIIVWINKGLIRLLKELSDLQNGISSSFVTEHETSLGLNYVKYQKWCLGSVLGESKNSSPRYIGQKTVS